MKEYEIHVYASYTWQGVKEHSYFKRYRTAKNAAEAKKNLKAELKAEGYRNIQMQAIA